jgi:hypothetical protein
VTIDAIKQLIIAVALAHGVHAGFMLEVAGCESSFNPLATNGPNRGLYQISDYGKAAAFRRAGYDNPYDPAQAANFFAEQVIDGQEGAWTCARLVQRPASLFFSATRTNVSILPTEGFSE